MNVQNSEQKIAFYFLLSIFAAFILYLSYSTVPIGSDMGRVWRFSKIFLNSPQESFATLEPFLPVSLYGTLFGLAGTQFPLALVQGISSVLVVLVICNYLYKRYGFTAGVMPLLITGSSYQFLERATSLVPYPLFLLFSTLSLMNYLAFLEQKKDRYLYISALFIVFSIYTFNLSLVFLIPVFFHGLVLFLTRKKNERKGIAISLIKYYSVVVVLIIPWFIWRYQAAGMNFYKNPITWLMQKYWSKYNIVLFDRPTPLSREYFSYFFDFGIKEVLGSYFIVILACIGFIKSKYRSFLFFWILAPLIPILIGRLPTEERYLYGMLPPILITSGIGIEYIRKESKSLRNIAVMLLIAVLLTLFSKNIVRLYQLRLDHRELSSEMVTLRNYIDNKKSIYFRSFQYQILFKDNIMISPSYMNEEDALNFIAWTNEEAIESILKKYDISWVILYNSLLLENKYNGWISLAMPLSKPGHYTGIQQSRGFEKVATTENFTLYKVINYGN